MTKYINRFSSHGMFSGHSSSKDYGPLTMEEVQEEIRDMLKHNWFQTKKPNLFRCVDDGFVWEAEFIKVEEDE